MGFKLVGILNESYAILLGSSGKVIHEIPNSTGTPA